jgi:hypothetical protein
MKMRGLRSMEGMASWVLRESSSRPALNYATHANAVVCQQLVMVAANRHSGR